MWSIESGKLKQTGHLKPKQYYGNTGYLYSMEFSPDGQSLFIAKRPGHVLIPELVVVLKSEKRIL